MAPQDRFESLESAPLPEEVKTALGRLSRFDALEIGAEPKAPAPSSAPALSSGAPAGPGSLKCGHCGQLNEAGRQTCWACYRRLGPDPAPKSADKGPSDITLVLDGVTYASGQKDLPDDIQELMARIRKQGYSQELLTEWRSWRATRHEAPLPTRPFEPVIDVENTTGSDDARGIKVFRGQRVSVIRLDGKVYTSDDPNLSPELKTLFAYIEAHGVTPALMDHLRQMGEAKIRPSTTAFPSDGDLAFWNSVKAAAPAAPAAPRPGDAGSNAPGERSWTSQDAGTALRVALAVGAILAYLIAAAVFR